MVVRFDGSTGLGPLTNSLPHIHRPRIILCYATPCVVRVLFPHLPVFVLLCCVSLTVPMCGRAGQRTDSAKGIHHRIDSNQQQNKGKSTPPLYTPNNNTHTNKQHTPYIMMTLIVRMGMILSFSFVVVVVVCVRVLVLIRGIVLRERASRWRPTQYYHHQQRRRTHNNTTVLLLQR